MVMHDNIIIVVVIVVVYSYSSRSRSGNSHRDDRLRHFFFYDDYVTPLKKFKERHPHRVVLMCFLFVSLE